MGANAQTTVPTFVASQVLTADQMNQSARTGVPVFSSTVTRDAGFGGTGEKTLAEGQLCYVEGTGLQSYNAAGAWVTWGTAPSAGALVLIKTQTIGTTVSSVTVTDAFSSTYDNYMITVTGGVASIDGGAIGLQLGATTTGYYAGYGRITYSSAAASNANDNNAAQFVRSGRSSTNTLFANIYLHGPNLAKNTFYRAWDIEGATGSVGGYGAGFLNNSTQYTAFTLNASTGTWTGGTIRVYGYVNS
jgi:hypothetical protein